MKYFFNRVLFRNTTCLEIPGDPPPPKSDPDFELKPLRDTLKYAYLDEKKIYPVIENSKEAPCYYWIYS